ncbi:MAG: hypothetical protein ACOYMG_15020, partial [Candidatus Methylumidiphilus sp.]
MNKVRKAERKEHEELKGHEYTLYFQDPVFQARAAVPSPNKSDRLTTKTVKKPPVTITLDWKN